MRTEGNLASEASWLKQDSCKDSRAELGKKGVQGRTHVDSRSNLESRS